MINSNKKNVLQKVDLETGIYRILSDETENSQNELLEELNKYSQRIKEHDLELKADKGNLSKKLGSLETEGVILKDWKKMTDRDQYSYSYYIKKDLPTFEHIMGHLAKDIGTAMDFSIHNQRIWSALLEKKEAKYMDLTFQSICGLITTFIRSPYTRDLINIYGIESVYHIFRKEVHGHCGLEEFIEHAKILIHNGKVIDLAKFDGEFLADCEALKLSKDLINKLFSKTD
jgi:ATP-dependent RNA circularization protein (DNA/RNA ligase family)